MATSISLLSSSSSSSCGIAHPRRIMSVRQALSTSAPHLARRTSTPPPPSQTLPTPQFLADDTCDSVDRLNALLLRYGIAATERRRQQLRRASSFTASTYVERGQHCESPAAQSVDVRPAARDSGATTQTAAPPPPQAQ